MTNIRVRAVIPHQKGLILIHRIRTDAQGRKKEYYVFPGGGMEEQDSSLEACVEREVYEEIGVVVKAQKKLYTLCHEDTKEIFFLCDYISGEMGKGEGPEFTSEFYKDRGAYLTEIVPIKEIYNINLLAKVRDALIRDLQHYGSFELIKARELK